VRVAHLADLHLGFRQYYRQTPAGLNQREVDVATAFRRAVEGVIAARPELIVIAGDLFHAVRPSNQAIVFCFQQLQRIRSDLPNAALVVVAGNHDTPRATETGTILRLFAELGVHVVTEQAEWIPLPRHDLAVLAAPHQAVVAPDRPSFRREGGAKYQVLVVHGEVEGLFPLDRWWVEPGGALLDARELEQGGFDYVALGHYHVLRRLKPTIWYAGALDYVSPNPWGELIEQRKTGVRGKGWLLADLDSGEVTPQWIDPPRGVRDLEPIDAADLSAAELDRAVADRLDAVPGGLADQIVRLVVHEAPRHVVRELDHAAIRAAKAKALHLHLDFRRPELRRTVGVGAPSARQTLTDVLREYLKRRPLPDRVDRERFVREGVALLEATVEPEGRA
jgi:DNA repair exonuclease SbcCD nuclease subunit